MSESTLDEAKLAEVDREIGEARAHLRQMESRRREILLAPWGVREGSIVRRTGYVQRGTLARVVTVDTPFGRQRPSLKANPQIKDGSWSKACISIYGEWELVEASPTPTASVSGAQGGE